MKIGQPYNPFKLFYTYHIPQPLMPIEDLSFGAKCMFSVLSRFAGKNGDCYPSIQTLSKRMGCSPRQVSRYIQELIEFKLVRQNQQYTTSSVYQFLWHPILEDPETDVDDEEGQPPPPKSSSHDICVIPSHDKNVIPTHDKNVMAAMTHMSSKEGHTKLSHIEVKTCGEKPAAKISGKFPSTTGEQENQPQQQNQHKTKPVSEEKIPPMNFDEISAQIAAKKELPAGSLVTHWKRRVAENFPPAPGDLVFVSLKEGGQLKKLANVCKEMTREMIDYAVANWMDFATSARFNHGLDKFPAQPHIGFLLLCHSTALQKMHSIAEAKKQKANPVTTQVVKVTTPVVVEPKPTPEEVAAIMKEYGF